MFNYKLFNIDGLYFEITDCEEEYECAFVEEIRGQRKIHYRTNLGKNTWMKIDVRYIGNFFVEARNNKGVLKHRISFLQHLKDKRVFISFDSSSLGDTIAWMPYCLEFKKKYQCDVIVSTFKNFLFESVYPEIEFVKPGSVVENIVAMPQLGWHWDSNKEPVNPVTIPLQKAACNILHLPYKEMRPRMAYVPKPFTPDNKYVCISVQSTSQLKLWDKWQELVNRLKDMGYDVYELSKDDCDLKNVYKPQDKSLENVMDILASCEFYIGLSSGISWLAWAMEVPVVMIANFTEANHEFECIRVENRSVCNGCWNNPKFRFNKGDWNWCPEHEDTPRQHECHKSISVEQVLSQLKTHLLTD
jgi:autotransporter strand-loop-strand O-heptosyltransferase